MILMAAAFVAVAVGVSGCTADQLNKTATIGGGGATTQPTAGAAAVNVVGTAATDAAPIVSLIPDWGTLSGWILAGVGVAATAYLNNKSKGYAAVIAAAAPGVGQLVAQATDGKITANDITNVAQLSQGVIALLGHPAAAAAVAATSPAMSVTTAPAPATPTVVVAAPTV